MTGSDYEKALDFIQDEKFGRAKEHISKEDDMNLYAELERLSFAQNAVSNYADRLIEDLAERLSEEE
jgi:hypothetical protein